LLASLFLPWVSSASGFSRDLSLRITGIDGGLWGALKARAVQYIVIFLFESQDAKSPPENNFVDTNIFSLTLHGTKTGLKSE
jgi:hypothetical protein